MALICCTYLQFASLFELVHVALTLERTTGSQEHILVCAIDVLDPVGQPSDCLVVHHGLPFARDVWFGNGNALANIDSDVLRTDANLHLYVSQKFLGMGFDGALPLDCPSLDGHRGP